MAQPPQGWKQGQKSNIYEANISQINIPTGTVSIVAETDKTTGSYTVYSTQGINFIGGRTPIYTTSAGGTTTIQNQTLYNTLKIQGDITKLDSTIKPKAYQINQTFGTDAEKRKVSESTLYLSEANKALIDPNNQKGPLSASEREIIENDKIASRDDYGKKTPIVYPVELKVEYQDCIKFSIVKYKQTGLKGFGPGDQSLRRVNVGGGTPQFKDKKREILGTIVLPIPGGIQDSNRVQWSGSSPLYDPQSALGLIVQTALKGEDVGKETQEQLKNANISALKTSIIGKVTEGAINTNNLMQRQFGVVINPNLELLFNSPDLRQFSFSFKLSPRSAKEAEVVKKIIRSFKQSMSVKRSASSFLLQTPHTFAISYIFKDKSHPYLNQFKECALTSCNVNYTPEGTYMSFEDGSMVSYQLDLTFQELEPVYDDDYDAYEKDNNLPKDSVIGY